MTFGIDPLGAPALGLVFVDETGLNPLPAGIFVQVFNSVTDVLIGEAWTQPGGVCSIAAPLNVECYAEFSYSSQAPGQGSSCIFTNAGGPEGGVVTVTGYRSPSLSGPGYAAFEMTKLVRLWQNTKAKSLGGNAYALGAGFGAGIAAIDAQAQQVLQMDRLQSSVDGQVDTWSMDFVGPLFGRYPGESDPIFISRNRLMVSRPRTTLNAITAFVTQFYESVLAGWNSTGSEGLAFDTAGAFDVSGGFNTPPAPPVPKTLPPILVWDGMSQPKLATTFGIVAGEFVIQLGLFASSLLEQLAFDTAGGFGGGPHGDSPGSGSFSNAITTDELPVPTATAPDPRLGLLINWLAKGASYKPLYLIGQL